MNSTVFRQLFLTFLFFSGLNLYGQISILKRPKDYLVPDGHILPKKASKLTNDIRQSAWSVMADSSGRVIYQDKRSRKKIRSAEFLESFFVIGESRKSLQLARFTDTIPINGKVAKSALVGWMLKSDLILWDFGICDPVNGVMKRLYPIEKVNPVNLINPSVHLLTSERKVDSCRFYYLVKRRGKQIILAKNGIFGADFKEAILGWFPLENFVEIGLPSGFLFSSTEPLDTFLRVRNFQMVASATDKGMLSARSFILLNGNNLLFPNFHFAPETRVKGKYGSNERAVSSYFNVSNRRLTTFQGFEFQGSFMEQRGVCFKSVVIPKVTISEMNDLYIKQVRSLDVSARKELAEGLKNTFSRLSFGLSKSSFSYKIGILKQFFGSRLIIPRGMERKSFDDVASNKKIEDLDLQYFIKNLEEVLNPDKDVFLPYYSFYPGENIVKFFPVNQFD